MLQHKKYAIKIIALILLVLLCLSAVNKVLIPKYYYNGDWPTTSTYLDFYNMEKDTIDVLFLGSSHCMAAFSPVDIYNEYGIKSYNLGCEQQNVLLSYYWLEEALRFQKPKYVFLDTFMLFSYDESAPLNTSEATTRKAVDFMKWSTVKYRAVSDICRIDTEQTLSSYLFPNERFHTRWKGMSENDFTLEDMGEQETLMGFFPIHFTCNVDTFEPLSATDATEYTEMVPVMKEYLEKLVALCEKENIELVLTKTPTMFFSQGSHNTVSSFAKEHELEYIDFNESNVYEGAGLNFALDSCDTDHVSFEGAKKVSSYIGSWLTGKVDSGISDAQWDKRVAFYNHYLKDISIGQETDISRYLQLIQDNNYSVLISVMGDASELFAMESEKLRTLGIHTGQLQMAHSYYAVLDGGVLIDEAASAETLTVQGTVREGRVTYKITSGGSASTNHCSILVDGNETAVRHEGMNITVYCNDKKKVIDRVCFMMQDGLAKCIR